MAQLCHHTTVDKLFFQQYLILLMVSTKISTIPPTDIRLRAIKAFLEDTKEKARGIHNYLNTTDMPYSLPQKIILKHLSFQLFKTCKSKLA